MGDKDLPTNEDREKLKELVERIGIYHTIDMLADICGDNFKADNSVTEWYELETELNDLI